MPCELHSYLQTLFMPSVLAKGSFVWGDAGFSFLTGWQTAEIG
jgi:hypothetical protein